MFQEWLRVVAASLISIAVMFVLTKIMGKRELSQLSMFDYINGITLGSIASELTITDISEWYRPITAMVVYGVVTVAIAIISNKSLAARRLFEGSPIILFDNGTIYEKNLMRVKMDVNELLTSCRYAGYFDLNEVQTAILETNGNISVLPRTSARTVTTEDLNIDAQQACLTTNIVLDGEVLEKCLKRTGNDEAWLKKQLDECGVKLNELILATCDNNNKFTPYIKTNKVEERSIFL